MKVFALAPIAVCWILGLICESALGISVIPSGQHPQFGCPNCQLGQGSKYGCDSFGSTALCVECPAGQAACGNGNFSDRNGQGCLDLQIENDHCGACGNRCSGATPSCVAGQCVCDVSQSARCTPRSFCDATAKTCTTCPAGKANCDVGDDTGVSGDCEASIDSDSENCGACGVRCGQGETCVNGQCACGTNPACKYPQTCDGTQCLACTSVTNDRFACAKKSISDFNGYCTTGNVCAECPAGFGDCQSHIRDDPGTDDTGTSDDCETPLNTRANCGACGARCNGDAQACCSGTCKCGKYVDNTAPTTEECQAAVQCKTTEYCDEQYGMCLSLLPGNEVCDGNADEIDDYDGLYGGGDQYLCGSCNRTESNLAYRGGFCRAYTPDGCGVANTQCLPHQTCKKGKCVCDVSFHRFFSWIPALDEDPDGDNKYDTNGKPESGCTLELITNVAVMRLDRIRNLLQRFEECAARATTPISQFTVQEFSNATWRATICEGGVGKCPASFCNDIFTNLTQVEKAPYCSAVEDTMAKIRSCVINYIPAGQTQGDPTCADIVAREFARERQSEFRLAEGYNLLGCRQPNPNWVYTIGGPSESWMGRADVAKQLLLTDRPTSAPTSAPTTKSDASFAKLSALVVMVVSAIMSVLLA